MSPSSRRTVVLGATLCGLRAKQLASFFGVHRNTIFDDRVLLRRRHRASDPQALVRAIWTPWR